ncbi:MAG: hypothetical protein PHW03_09765 [Eubacteriales bacterium]|nr:hypothetical protein [Eubacteriales bacterium]
MENYIVKRIKSGDAKEFIRENHYSHTCHNGPSPCYGLFKDEEMIGCLCFATPCSENVRRSVFGSEYKNHVTELHRLFIFDVTPKNTESWFISRCLKQLKIDKPIIWGVLSFSDLTEGHTGVIYKATNALFLGTTAKATFYRDSEGRLRHPRQNGVNVTKEMAKERGWTPEIRWSKNRYLYLLADNRRHKKVLLDLLKLKENK